MLAIKLRSIRKLFFLTVVGTFGLLLSLAYPIYAVFALLGMFTLIMLAQQLNFYKIAMIMKRYMRNVSKLRHEIRAKLQMGLTDYRDIYLDDESKSRRSERCGFIS